MAVFDNFVYIAWPELIFYYYFWNEFHQFRTFSAFPTLAFEMHIVHIIINSYHWISWCTFKYIIQIILFNVYVFYFKMLWLLVPNINELLLIYYNAVFQGDGACYRRTCSFISGQCISQPFFRRPSRMFMRILLLRVRALTFSVTASCSCYWRCSRIVKTISTIQNPYIRGLLYISKILASRARVMRVDIC